MPSFRTGRVTALLGERAGLQRVRVAYPKGPARPAYVLTRLVGPVAVGDEVVANTTAVDLGLGTGGWDVVHWNLARTTWSEPGPGSVLKLRYTSLQADVGAAEEHPGYAPPDDLGGRPVVACALHGQLGAVAVAFAAAAPPGRRLVYVMTDAAALPLALSDLVAELAGAGLVAATVTAGQAFGGDLEAVNVASALDVAVAVAGADAVVVGPGPGGVGTGTRRGFGALEVAGVVDVAGGAGGRPVVALRVSDADPRPRHRGLSHHSATALGAARVAALVAVPAGEEPPGGLDPRHRAVAVDVPDVAALSRAAGVALSSMGRTPKEDPRFFAYAGAAGALAARLAGGRGAPPVSS